MDLKGEISNSEVIYLGEQGFSTCRSAPDCGPKMPIFGQKQPSNTSGTQHSSAAPEPRLTLASQIWFVKVHVAVGTCLANGACVSVSAEHVYGQASFVDFLRQVQAAVKSVSHGRRPLVVLGRGHWVKYSEHWAKIRRFAEPVLLHDSPLQALFLRI